MSLKAEQILDDTSFAKREPRIYTTGAFLVPMKVKSGDKERFVWVVSDFNDDTYLDGELCSPVVYASSMEKMLQD
jgi:hypothetical protein